MHIPVNRWTVGVMVLLGLVFGSDFVEPLFKAVAVLSAPYSPAL